MGSSWAGPWAARDVGLADDFFGAGAFLAGVPGLPDLLLFFIRNAPYALTVFALGLSLPCPLTSCKGLVPESRSLCCLRSICLLMLRGRDVRLWPLDKRRHQLRRAIQDLPDVIRYSETFNVPG